MNRLRPEKQLAVLQQLVEGSSIRSTERITGVHRDTVCRTLRRIGGVAEWAMRQRMRSIPARRVQVDEIWTFVGKKQRRLQGGDDETRLGDFWTFVALDPESKVIPSYLVGKRDGDAAGRFLLDLKSRLRNRVQLSSDMWGSYSASVRETFGEDVDWGRIVKWYKAAPVGAGRYAPPKVSYVEREGAIGEPEEAHISTSLVERHNLTMRMGMRRFTRLTNGFSRSLENLKAAVNLYMAHYNFIRPHSKLGTTPAVAAGVALEPWTLQDFIQFAEWGQ